MAISNSPFYLIIHVLLKMSKVISILNFLSANTLADRISVKVVLRVIITVIKVLTDFGDSCSLGKSFFPGTWACVAKLKNNTKGNLPLLWLMLCYSDLFLKIILVFLLLGLVQLNFQILWHYFSCTRLRVATISVILWPLESVIGMKSSLSPWGGQLE